MFWNQRASSAGRSEGKGLVLKRQQRRPQQVFVRLRGRHPAFELDAAVACDQESIVRLGLWPNAALHVAALLVRQHVTA